MVISNSRKIIHIDMDAFYASVEQRDNPELRGKAIAVGGASKRGVITTASYEARKFGVRSAMPGFKAKLLCPHIIFVKPRFQAYKEASQAIRSVFSDYTDLIEPLSLDEAFLDVTENKKKEPLATKIAEQIRQQVFETTQLTCSAGVSYCKFLAKVASDMNKPNGITVIKPHQAENFLEQLPIEKFFGIGKVTAKKMQDKGIFTGADLKTLSEIEMAQQFGKMGRYYYRIVRGVDDRPVNNQRIRKSIGIERTLFNNVSEIDEIQLILKELIPKFYERLQKADNYGRTLTLKLKTADFKTITRSLSKNYFITQMEDIETIANQLLLDNVDAFEKLRLIGLSASNLQQENEAQIGGQLTMDL